MQDFRRLLVWQKAHQLTLAVYQTIDGVPSLRRFAGLRSQALRASSGVSANIAEGCGHRSKREFLRYIGMAIASVTELQNHLLLARDLHLIPSSRHDELSDRIVEVRRMLSGFARSIRAQPDRPDDD